MNVAPNFEKRAVILSCGWYHSVGTDLMILQGASQTPSPQAKTRPSQFPSIFALYLILRLIVVVFYRQEGLFNVYTDYYYYYRTAMLSEQGNYPLVNMWYEYPPILAYLPQAIYWLVGSFMSMGGVDNLSFLVFYLLLGMVLLACDAGVLLMLHRLGQRLWGEEEADLIAWVYSAQSLPLFFLTYTHQAVPVFFTVLAVYFFTSGKKTSSAAALGLGIVSKLTPVFLLPAAMRLLWPRHKEMFRYLLVTVIVVGLAYLPFFLLGGGKWVAASWAALLGGGSYGTPWAILDGNWGSGTYSGLPGRLVLEQAYAPHANPAVVPGWLAALAVGLPILILYLRPLGKGETTEAGLATNEVGGENRREARTVIWLITLTALAFHLWSRGWSPHWAMTLIPLFLLCAPEGSGLRWSLALTGLVFIEWPIKVAFDLKWVAATFILFRSALFIWVGFRLARMLWPPAMRQSR